MRPKPFKDLDGKSADLFRRLIGFQAGKIAVEPAVPDEILIEEAELGQLSFKRECYEPGAGCFSKMMDRKSMLRERIAETDRKG